MKSTTQRSLLTIPSVTAILLVLLVTGSLLAGRNAGNPEPVNEDSIASVEAFRSVYKVLMSPRCMNCHPAGDIPLQGDDSHLHTMSPRRGKDGKGVYAMKCSNCHQAENTPGLNTPPGNPNWHLPPANMRMVFQGRTAHQLAKQILDPKQNGHKDINKLLEHAHDTLVKAGWNPGEGRTLPPLTHEEFVQAWNTWLKRGAYIPAP
jgi:mono/diheme cytochrome c family protein